MNLNLYSLWLVEVSLLLLKSTKVSSLDVFTPFFLSKCIQEV